MNLTEAAKEYAGNHRKFDSFIWHAEPADGERWALVYTSNRDSDLLTRANEKVIREEMAPFEADGTAVWESHNHWLVGHVDGYALRVYDAEGNITPAFTKYFELMEALEGYPVLDDMVYSEMESEAEWEDWQNYGASDFRSELGKLMAEHLPEFGEWEERLDEASDDALWSVFHDYFEAEHFQESSGTAFMFRDETVTEKDALRIDEYLKESAARGDETFENIRSRDEDWPGEPGRLF